MFLEKLKHLIIWNRESNI